MSEDKASQTTAYHLRRAGEETARANKASEPGARYAHHALAKLHHARAGNDEPPGLLIVKDDGPEVFGQHMNGENHGHQS